MKASIWARAIADKAFREGLIEDPLRALAAAHDVAATPDEVRRLEEMTAPERAELLEQLVQEVRRRRVHQMWGERFWTPDDPRPPSDAG